MTTGEIITIVVLCVLIVALIFIIKEMDKSPIRNDWD